MAYIGSIGALVKVKCAASLSQVSTRPARKLQTMGGATAMQVGRRVGREWNMQFSPASTPADISAIQAFIDGEHGLGPWNFVSDWAPITNLVSPRGAVLESAVAHGGTSPNGGSMVLPDGQVAGRSWIVDPQTALFLPWVDSREPVPVIPGVPVTASAWVDWAGAARMRLAFYASDGTLKRQVSGTNAPGTEATRISVTAVPESGEAYCLMSLGGVAQTYRIARPQITWTDTVRDWASGEGAPKVHLSSISTDVTLATENSAYASASFTITEVG